MAYYSGTAASLTALRTALLAHAQTDGWTLTGNVLSKAGVFFQITEDAYNIKCLGCESNAVANPAPGVVMIGRVHTSLTITFPCNYEVFGFSQEIYWVVNYDVDTYQWMAFGKSTVPGLVGQGGWCAATIGSAWSTYYNTNWIMMSENWGGSNGNNQWAAPGIFSVTYASQDLAKNCWVNHGLDGLGWGFGSYGDYIGWRHLSPLYALNPSSWNSESVLLPARALLERPSYKSSLIADLENCRLFRIDNITPGDVLTLGSDEWKVFPFYKKNSLERSGLVLGMPMNHTGTFGWAIRYEGP